MKLKTTFVIVAILLLQACATVYTDENFSDYQTAHKTTALLPFEVIVELNKIPEGVNEAMLREAAVADGYIFQEQLYDAFYNEYQKGIYTVTFQNIEETNRLMQEAGISITNMNEYSRSEIAEILNVDSVFSGRINRASLASDGAAFAAGIFTNTSVATNRVGIKISLYDGDNGRILWNYNHTIAGSYGSNPEKLAQNLLKAMTKKFPYLKAK